MKLTLALTLLTAVGVMAECQKKNLNRCMNTVSKKQCDPDDQKCNCAVDVGYSECYLYCTTDPRAGPAAQKANVTCHGNYNPKKGITVLPGLTIPNIPLLDPILDHK